MPKLTSYLVYSLFSVVTLFAAGIGYKMVEQAPNAQVYIKAEGLSKVQYETLKKRISYTPSQSFLKTDLQTVRDQISDLTWVDEVSISRDWHKGIVVQALPRQAVARFGSERLVDANGAVFQPANDASLTAQAYSTLQGDDSQSVVIMRQMQTVNELFEPLGLKVEDMILTARQTWLIRFDSGLRIIVDGEDTGQKLMNVSNVLQNQLADKVIAIQAVDARYKNGFSIDWK